MRRTASEVIRSLEERVARLEKQSNQPMQNYIDNMANGTLPTTEASDLAVNQMRDIYERVSTKAIKEEYEAKLDAVRGQINRDLGVAKAWFAHQVRGQVASIDGLKKFYRIKNESGIPMPKSLRYYMYLALIADGTIRLP